MHIPDAVLSPTVSGAASILGAGGLIICLRRLQHKLGERTAVLMGTMSAFVFAAQMVNFPLFPLPISGHLLGGVLSAVMLGPSAGAVVMGTVLIVQCFLFGDGGLTALGANFVNIGLIGSLGGYLIYSSIRRAIGGQPGILIGAMLGAWFSVILASGAFAIELAASVGWANFFNVLGWMALVHTGIGLGEALITGTVLRFILQVRPDLIDETSADGESHGRRVGRVAIGGLGIALAVAVFLAPFASEYEDGLEWVGGKLGFLKEGETVIAAPIPDYQLPIPGTRSVKVATALAGLVGSFAVFGMSCGLAGIFLRRKPPAPPIMNASSSNEYSHDSYYGSSGFHWLESRPPAGGDGP